MHVKDAAERGPLDAHVAEAALDGLEGGERSGSKIGVLIEGFLGTDI